MSYSIYQIQNTINLKSYIGYSNNVRLRWNKHVCDLRKGKHGNKHLQYSWLKYGYESFTLSILAENLTKESALVYEKVIIKLWKDAGHCYNMTDGGDSGPSRAGSSPSEETRKKMSKSQKGHPVSEETRKKIGDIHRGKPLSLETRRKMSESRKGRASSIKATALLIERCSKTYYFINPEGEMVEVINLALYCRNNNLNPTSMYELNSGKKKAYKGWKKYYQEKPPMSSSLIYSLAGSTG